MNLIRPAVWVCAAALLVAAEDQFHPINLRPVTANAQAPNRPFRGDNHEPNDQQWSNVLQWMQQHSPNRLQFYRRMNNGQALQAKQLMWNEYRILQAVNYRPLKEALVAQAEAQDQVFGAQIGLREAQQSHNADRQDTARDALKSAVGHLVDSEQKVIETRIEKLQRDLDRITKNHDRRVESIYLQKLRQASGQQTQDATVPPSSDSQD